MVLDVRNLPPKLGLIRVNGLSHGLSDVDDFILPLSYDCREENKGGVKKIGRAHV